MSNFNAYEFVYFAGFYFKIKKMANMKNPLFFVSVMWYIIQNYSWFKIGYRSKQNKHGFLVHIM